MSLFIFACAEEQQELLSSEVGDDEPDYEVDDEPDYETEEEYEQIEEQEEVEDETTEEETSDEINEEEIEEGITRQEIAENNNEESCWVGYYGYVYDLTSWLNQHPGGANEILPHCGTVEEFTEAYDNRHGQKDTLNRNDAIAELI